MPVFAGARLDDPGRSVTEGTTFVGRNKRGAARWVTRCRVTAAIWRFASHSRVAVPATTASRKINVKGCMQLVRPVQMGAQGA